MNLNCISLLIYKFIDTDEHRLYWINVDGDIKSSKDDGYDVKTIHSTHVAAYYYAIGVVGSYICYGNAYNQLLMVSKTPGSTPTVLYNNTSRIYSIFVLYSPGKLITIINISCLTITYVINWSISLLYHIKSVYKKLRHIIMVFIVKLYHEPLDILKAWIRAMLVEAIQPTCKLNFIQIQHAQ